MRRVDFLLKTRQILLKRRDALWRSLTDELAMRSCSEFSADEYDEAQDAESDVVFARIADCESRELAAIENALDRLQNGQYGSCEECGGRIPLTRLQALPYVTLCIQCQLDSELLDRLHGSPAAAELLLS